MPISILRTATHTKHKDTEMKVNIIDITTDELLTTLTFDELIDVSDLDEYVCRWASRNGFSVDDLDFYIT